MSMVIITAIGIGLATVIGSLIGFIFKNISHKFSDIILSFAAGVMLSSAILGLIIPSIEFGGKFGIITTVIGIFVGAFCLNLIDAFVPHLHRLAGTNTESNNNTAYNKILLFVTAVAIHNFPEGIAAGIGFGTDNQSQALLIALGIAIQNIPEGIVIIAPMLSVGISPKKTFIIAMITGIIEVIGTLIGYFSVSVASFILPFALSFAGGTMLYIVSDEMIPETHSHGNERSATYSFLLGFCLILISDILLS